MRSRTLQQIEQLEISSRVDHAAPALVELLAAYRSARQLDLDPWQLAVELPELCARGLSRTELRTLLAAGYTEHARETTEESDRERRFEAPGSAKLGTSSCFVLTEHGVTALEQIRGESKASTGSESDAARGSESDGAGNGSVRRTDPQSTVAYPHWDGDRRELRLGEMLVKRFKKRAMNQETVLGTFEEDGWPPRIDDPLPPRFEQDAKQRLRDTIKCLNRRQWIHLIRFRADGTGEGVIWELIEPQAGCS